MLMVAIPATDKHVCLYLSTVTMPLSGHSVLGNALSGIWCILNMEYGGKVRATTVQLWHLELRPPLLLLLVTSDSKFRYE